MKKIIYSLIILVISSSVSFGQKVAKEKKYDKIIYNEVTKNVGDLTVYMVDAVSTDAYFKFKLRIQNKSANYVILDVNKMTIVDMKGVVYNPSEKPLVIAPGDFGVRVIDIKGSDFRMTTLKVNLDGLTSAPANGKVYEAPIFKLPVATNDFTTGPFKVVQKENDLKTDLSLVKMEVTYTGKDIAIFTPSKVVLKMPSGNEFANMSYNKKSIVLNPGESDVFTLKWADIDVKSNGDMQKAQMQILFKDAFVETKGTTLNGDSFELTINEKESD